MFLTTHFFGTKIQRYMHQHGVSATGLARVAAKNLANGSITPHAWRQKPIPVEEILASDVVNYLFTRYMYCSGYSTCP
jgi:acetyl-CoA acetyltransferase